jgi:hypothetical protein
MLANNSDIKQVAFWIGAGVLFFLAQLWPALNSPIIMDEFSVASSIKDVVNQIPYQDYTPYKPVLGYLVLSYFVETGEFGNFDSIINGRLYLAAMNAVLMAMALFMLRKICSLPSLLCASVCIIFMTTFSFRSTDIRVDMLTAWASMFSLILVLRKEYILAGLTIGIGFLFSQKIAFAAVSGGISLFCFHLMQGQGLKAIGKPFLMMMASFVPIALYVGYFEFYVGVGTNVFGELFLKSQEYATRDPYNGMVRFHWIKTLVENPIQSLGIIFAIFYGFSVVIKDKNRTHKSVIAGIFGIVMTLLCLSYRLPWVYFQVVLLAPALVIMAVAIDHMRSKHPANFRSFGKTIILLSPILYAANLIALDSNQLKMQKASLAVLEDILAENQDYRFLMGTDVIGTNSRHVNNRTRWLDHYQMEAISASEVEQRSLLEALEAHPPEVLVKTRRTELLGKILGKNLLSGYSHVCGNIYRLGSSERQYQCPDGYFFPLGY